MDDILQEKARKAYEEWINNPKNKATINRHYLQWLEALTASALSGNQVPTDILPLLSDNRHRMLEDNADEVVVVERGILSQLVGNAAKWDHTDRCVTDGIDRLNGLNIPAIHLVLEYDDADRRYGSLYAPPGLEHSVVLHEISSHPPRNGEGTLHIYGQDFSYNSRVPIEPYKTPDDRLSITTDIAALFGD